MMSADNKVNKDMTFADVLKQYPKAGPILAGYGLHCIGCRIGAFETIEQGALAHGLSPDKIDAMIREINTMAV